MKREWTNALLELTADRSSIFLLQGAVMESHLAAFMEGHLAVDMKGHLAVATAAVMAALLNMEGDSPTLTEVEVIMAVDMAPPSLPTTARGEILAALLEGDWAVNTCERSTGCQTFLQHRGKL
jgi:hypothetical protein